MFEIFKMKKYSKNLLADFVMEKDIQLVISILKDKLPDNLLDKANVVVELSQEDKLFRIE